MCFGSEAVKEAARDIGVIAATGASTESEASLFPPALGFVEVHASAARRDLGVDDAIRQQVQGCVEAVGLGLPEHQCIRDSCVTNLPGKEYSQAIEAAIPEHTNITTSATFLDCQAKQLCEDGRTVGEHLLCDVPEVAEGLPPGPQSHDLFHPAKCLRGDPPARRNYRGVHDGESPHLQGESSMVSRESSGGREEGASSSNQLASESSSTAQWRCHLTTKDINKFSHLYDNPDSIVARCLSGYHPNPPTPMTKGKLDPIPEGLPQRVDFSDRSLHPVYPASSPVGIAQRILFSEDFSEFLKEGRTPPRFRSSQDVHRRHVAELLAARLCHKKSRADRELGFARFFTVLKKIDDDGVAVLRTILDCETANEAFVEAPPVNLCPLHAVLKLFSEVESMRALDLRHWFHQIKVGKALSKWFTIAFGPERVQWDCLPMGFKWAPFISQAFTTFAVAGSEALKWDELPQIMTFGNVKVVVIYDNILAGGPEKELDEFWQGLVVRLEAMKALVKPGSDTKACGGTTLDAIGVRWLPGMPTLQWQLLPKFVDKINDVLRLLDGPRCSTKQISSVIGLLAWGRYATQSDICDLHQAYALLAEDVRRGGWRGVTTCDKYLFVFQKLAALQASGWQQYVPARDEILAFTDAHNLGGYGHVGGSPLVCRAHRWPVGSKFEPKDMFFLEAIGLKHTVFAFAKPLRRLFVASDNMALVFAVRKRSTSCPRTARVLHEMFEYLRSIGAELELGWIPTQQNPADEMSRHLPLDVEKLGTAERHVVWVHPPSPEFGAKLGRVVGPGA